MKELPASPLSSDQLRAFVAVAGERGFSRAARALGRSQSSISQAVAALEDELGEALLVRGTRATTLTAAGRIVLAHAERALAELEAVRDELAALRAVAAGTLALGTSDTLATYVLPPVFAAFRQRYPDVDLSLDNRPSPAIAARVGARELDVGVVSLPLGAAADAVEVRPLMVQRDVLVVPVGHRLARRRRIALADLAGEPLLLLDRSTSTRVYLDERIRAAGLQARVYMEMSSVEVLKRLVELGFGVSIVPELAAAREVAAGSLVALRVRELGAARQVGVVWPRRGPLGHAARAFIELAGDVLATSSARAR